MITSPSCVTHTVCVYSLVRIDGGCSWWWLMSFYLAGPVMWPAFGVDDPPLETRPSPPPLPQLLAPLASFHRRFPIGRGAAMGRRSGAPQSPQSTTQQSARGNPEVLWTVLHLFLGWKNTSAMLAVQKPQMRQQQPPPAAGEVPSSRAFTRHCLVGRVRFPVVWTL